MRARSGTPSARRLRAAAMLAALNRVIGNDRWAWSAVPGREKLLAPAWFGGRI